MIKAVIGLGFGDEGKGQIVNYLCKNFRIDLVVRFNGGHQAGHTVINNGVRHVFSNFGSGTLQGIDAYWSEFCTIDPIGIQNEYKILQQKGFEPVLYINSKCPVTTPYDKSQNQIYNMGYGTVGVGFGDTINREEHYYSLLFEDLFYDSVMREKIRLIEQFYRNQFDLKHFYNAIDFVKANCYKIDSLPKANNYLLEGAQGLLLDQHYGFFPHVTRSNTGSANIQKLFPDKEVEFYLVTRAYQTRHGNGFMTNEKISHHIKLKNSETNVYNKYQGEFRYSLLDLDLIKYAIEKDKFINSSRRKVVVTCINDIKNSYCYTFKDNVYRCANKYDFIDRIKNSI